MILSHRHRFIFIKTSKTAGTSVEMALAAVCGDDDIITPFGPRDEKTRWKLGIRGPQHYLAPFAEYRAADWYRLLTKRERKKRFYNHISAREIRARVPEEVWSSYYKFAFERSPWDRVVSQYYWLYKSEPRPGFSEFLNSGVPLRLRKRGLDLYTIDAQVAVDRVCRYEALAEELEAVRQEMGIEEPLVLPSTKSSYRPPKEKGEDPFTDADREKVHQLFAAELELLGYGEKRQCGGL
jgi:hypothetical protein